MARLTLIIPVALAVALTAGCKTANKAANGIESAGESVADAAGDTLDGAVSLANVDLSNVLNDLSLDLHIDKANIPINAQIPVTLAANICGVSINVLSASGGAKPTCTAKSTSPELEQAVQQQLAANGSVGGGDQTGAGATGASGSTTSTPSTTTPDTSTSTAEPTAPLPSPDPQQPQPQ